MNDAALSPKQVRAARALLAWNQADLARAAKVGTSTIADFERGERNPVVNNVQAIRDALLAEGLLFQDSGVVLAQKQAVAPAIRPGRPWRWLHTSDLAQWAGRRDGPAAFPELMSRLILATCGPIAMRFPAGDSIHHAGYDGQTDNPVANTFVPAGRAVWELGTQRQKIREKADYEYRHRTDAPLGIDSATTAFLFVTPHRWPGKDEWAAARAAEGIWHSVFALDGDDLVHWLEQCPAVSEWLATRIGKKPEGLSGLLDRWDQWASATKPKLSTALILADRDEQAADVLKWLYGPAAALAIQAEATDEAISFLYAAIDPLPDLYRQYWLSRTVVVESDRAAADLLGLGAPLVVVLAGGDAGLAARLVEAGHHVYRAFGSDAGAPEDVIRLPRPWSYSIERALVEAGVPEQDVGRIARQAGRSLAIVRRVLPAGPAPRPSWAISPVSNAVLAAMLAGAWDADYSTDRAMLERLSGLPYGAIESELAPLAVQFDGPIRRSGSIWKLASLRDSWFLLADRLTEAQVETMLVCFHEVLSTRDPAFCDPDRRWRFDRHPPTRASVVLRHGLTEAIIGLAIFGERALLVRDATARADQAVRKLLEDADEEIWWSLAGDFRRLAEASPGGLLDAIEDSFAREDAPIRILFRQDEGFVHATEYLADMLWALEAIASSPDYVGQATLTLARLADADPGGKLRNRPKESLRRIFLPWRPQAAANAEDRLRLTDRILKHYPQVGWDLLIAIAPSAHGGMTMPVAQPRWRDFGGGPPETVTNHSLYRSYTAIGERLLAEAGLDAARWAQLTDVWSSFGPDWCRVAGDALLAAVDRFAETDRITLREKLRGLIAKHQKYSQADWAMDADALTPLQAAFDRLEPRAAADRHLWMFGHANRLFDSSLGWEDMLARQEQAQREAADEIWREAPDTDFVALAARVERPDMLGLALATSAMPLAAKEALLEQAIADPQSFAERLAQGLLIGLTRIDGTPPYAARFETWTTEQRPAHQLLALAFLMTADAATWALIDAAGDDVARAYWRGLAIYAIPKTADPDLVLDHFFAHDRGRGAVDYLGAHEDRPLTTEIILRALRHPSTIAPAGSVSDDDGMFSFHVARLFSRLDQATDLDAQTLADLEWVYFQALKDSERPPRLLRKALSEDPRFFVTLLTMLYRPEGEERVEREVETEAMVKVAHQAFDLLEGWSEVPGSDAEGCIDAAALETWVKDARKLCAEAHRLEVGDYKIGGFLSSARRIEGEAWPPEAVRDVIETSRSREIERGFEFGVYNGRGITTRMPRDGGDQERALAARYRRDARHSALEWPRMRAVLERIAEYYERDAEREDQSAEQGDWL